MEPEIAVPQFGMAPNPPSPGVGPSSTPTANPGIEADGLAQVGEAIKLLQIALPKFEVGGEPQKAVLDSIQKLSKIAQPGAVPPGVQRTALDNAQRETSTNSMIQALFRAGGNPTAGLPIPGMMGDSLPAASLGAVGAAQ